MSSQLQVPSKLLQSVWLQSVLLWSILLRSVQFQSNVNLGLIPLETASWVSSFYFFDSFYWALLHLRFKHLDSTAHLLDSTIRAQRLKGKRTQKVVNSIPGQYVTQLGMLSASPHHGKQSLSVPPPFP